MDDYVHCLLAYLNTAPALTLSLPSLSLCVSHTLSALTCPAPEIVQVSLDVLAKLALLLPSSHSLQPTFHQYGKGIISIVLQGVVQDFPEESLDEVEKIVAATISVGGGEVEGWVGDALAGVPGHVLPQSDRQAFITELQQYVVPPTWFPSSSYSSLRKSEGIRMEADRVRYLQSPSEERIRSALRNLVRSARRARERGRQSRKSLGGR